MTYHMLVIIFSNGPLTMEFETTRPGDISYYVDMIGLFS